MDTHSRLEGITPISHGGDRVWKIRKKQRTDDRSRQNGKKDRKEKEDRGSRDILTDHENEHGMIDDHFDDQGVYSSGKLNRRATFLIDVTI